MTKINILDAGGKKVKDIDTSVFNSKIRKDIIQKIVEAEKKRQLYAPSPMAGMQTSASGNVRHLRHSWKSDRGRGMSRIPKKRMSDRGARFFWVGAVIPGTKGGRRAHPPKINIADKKINKKEHKLGLSSALAMVSDSGLVKKNYSSLEKEDIKADFPLIIESKVLGLNTKDFLSCIKKILGNEKLYAVSIQKRKIKKGKGKSRTGKHRKNAGLLVVIGNKEQKKSNSVDIVRVDDLNIGDLASNGARLVIFTEESIKDLEKRLK